jgi:hypothetical protein
MLSLALSHHILAITEIEIAIAILYFRISDKIYSLKIR